MSPTGDGAEIETADGQDLVRGALDLVDRIGSLAPSPASIERFKEGEYRLRDLAEIAATLDRPSSPGWPLGLEEAASEALILLTSVDDHYLALESEGYERPIAEVFTEGPWVDVFRVTELLV